MTPQKIKSYQANIAQLEAIPPAERTRRQERAIGSMRRALSDSRRDRQTSPGPRAPASTPTRLTSPRKPVDDGAQVRRVLREVFENEGIAQVAVNAAWETLKAWAQSRPTADLDRLIQEAARQTLRLRPGSAYHVNRIRELYTVRATHVAGSDQ